MSAAQAPSPFQRDLHAFGLLIARLTLALVLVVRAAALAVPFTPLGPHLGFEPPPPTMLAAIAAITLAYLAAAEATKPFAIRAAARSRRYGCAAPGRDRGAFAMTRALQDTALPPETLLAARQADDAQAPDRIASAARAIGPSSLAGTT